MKRIARIVVCFAVPLLGMEHPPKRSASFRLLNNPILEKMNRSLEECPPFTALARDIYRAEDLTEHDTLVIADKVLEIADTTQKIPDRPTMIRTIRAINAVYPQIVQFLHIWADGKLSASADYCRALEDIPKLSRLDVSGTNDSSTCCQIL